MSIDRFCAQNKRCKINFIIVVSGYNAALTARGLTYYFVFLQIPGNYYSAAHHHTKIHGANKPVYFRAGNQRAFYINNKQALIHPAVK